MNSTAVTTAAPAPSTTGASALASPQRRTRLLRRLLTFTAALVTAVTLTANVSPAQAVAYSNGVVNPYGFGQVYGPGCTGSTLTARIDMQGGSSTTGMAFRFWFRPSGSSTWSTGNWHALTNARPNTRYSWGGDWAVFDEDIPLRGSGPYEVWAEFDFVYRGPWSPTEFVRITGFRGTYGNSNYTDADWPFSAAKTSWSSFSRRCSPPPRRARGEHARRWSSAVPCTSLAGPLRPVHSWHGRTTSLRRT
jgi:hypothetical protein